MLQGLRVDYYSQIELVSHWPLGKCVYTSKPVHIVGGGLKIIRITLDDPLDWIARVIG